MTHIQPSLRRDRLFRVSLSTVLALSACLSTHLVVALGLAGAVVWLDTLEHGLVVLAVALAALTIYAVVRHRRCGHCP